MKTKCLRINLEWPFLLAIRMYLFNNASSKGNDLCFKEEMHTRLTILEENRLHCKAFELNIEMMTLMSKKFKARNQTQPYLFKPVQQTIEI